jgi:hypothetical protein
MDRAPWLTADMRATMLDALAQVRQDAADRVPLDDFASAVENAVGVVRSTFGI